MMMNERDFSEVLRLLQSALAIMHMSTDTEPTPEPPAELTAEPPTKVPFTWERWFEILRPYFHCSEPSRLVTPRPVFADDGVWSAHVTRGEPVLWCAKVGNSFSVVTNTGLVDGVDAAHEAARTFDCLVYLDGELLDATKDT